jgi:WhiB family transcriptional regulator, redox-sensing transcriptional regulator
VTSLDRSDWRNAANCASTDPELFYDPDTPRSWADQQKAMKDALAVCDSCVVKFDCLVEAIHNGERDGIWGGTTEKERAPMIQKHLERKAAKASTVEHDQDDDRLRHTGGKGWAA